MPPGESRATSGSGVPRPQLDTEGSSVSSNSSDKGTKLPVSVRRITAPEKKTSEHIHFENAKSGAGEQLLLLDCRARACAKGVFMSQTPIAQHIKSIASTREASKHTTNHSSARIAPCHFCR